MATIDNMRVLFGQGTSASFVGELKEPNKLYFLQDTQEMYLGNVRYAFGKDITIQINGSGDVVANAIYDTATKTLTITRGNAGETTSVAAAIEAALASCVKHIYSERGSAIEVDDTDKDNVKLSLNIASAPHAGNVLLEECSDGLRANVEIPEVPVEGVKANDRILSLEGKYLATTLSITTENINGRQYVLLRGIDNVEISRFDATDFVASGMLQSVTLVDKIVDGEVHKFLVMTFIVDGGRTSTVEVDLNALMNVYGAAANGGLSMNEQNEFSITNTVTPEYNGLNSNTNIQFDSTVTLNTITYDDHGSITGKKAITFQIPATSGSAGVSGTPSKLLTFVSMSNQGVLSGETIDVVTGITSYSTNAQIPTAKSVYDLVDGATTKWDRF